MSDVGEVNAAVFRSQDHDAKFDYYMASLAIAIAGYLLTHSPRPQVGSLGSLFVLASICCLLASAYFALRRIQVVGIIVREQARGLRVAEACSQLDAALLALPETPTIRNPVSGKQVQRTLVADQLAATRADHETILKWLAQSAEDAKRYFAKRDGVLLTGILLAVVARLLGADLQ